MFSIKDNEGLVFTVVIVILMLGLVVYRLVVGN